MYKLIVIRVYVCYCYKHSKFVIVEVRASFEVEKKMKTSSEE